MIILNKGQQSAKDRITALVMEGYRAKDKFITLIGPAGTGKTTTLVEIIKALPRGVTIGLTAPTHKAAKVIRKMAFKAGIDRHVDVRTIHSALGLVMKPVDGDEVLYRDPHADERIYDVLVIDECSMLDDDLIGYILESDSVTIIFVGDSKQISPVNSLPGEISKTFTEVEQVCELTEVMRQGDGSPIIDLATELRLCQDNIHENFPMIQTNLLPDGSGINVLPKMHWFQEVIEIFKTDKFKADPDHCRCIAYTNDMVDDINDKVRKVLHGVDVKEYILGEVIVAQNAGQFHKNAEECEIKEIEELVDPIHMLPYYYVTLSSMDDGSIYRVNILKKESQVEYERKLSRFADLAKRLDKANSRKHWRDFWDLKKSFDRFKHVYAMTANKSQGSTFEHTFIWTPDFLRFGANMEIKQLVYTGTTRSSYRTTFAY